MRFFENNWFQKTVCGCLITLVLVISIQTAKGQPASKPATHTEFAARLSEQGNKTSKELDDIRKLLSRKDIEIAQLQTKLETTNTTLNAFISFLGLVLVLGTGGSLIGFIRSEKRATEAHSFALAASGASETRTAQAFSLAISGESASQSRAAEVHEKFLSGSRETLDLVNATLTLAKEASERAARTIEVKAKASIEDLDRDSQALLASVPSQDDRALIANPASRSNLRSLAHKIAGFEINRFILPQDIQLTPPCLFIRGMNFHLDQQFDDAISHWRQVAFSSNAPASLRSLAYYWIGYEENNLNRFGDAEQSFENALKAAPSTDESRRFELHRILIETRFFNKNKNCAEVMIDPMRELFESISRPGLGTNEDRHIRKLKIAISLGNITSQAGRELQMEGEEEKAGKRFLEAKGFYEIGSKSDKWAQFGLAEMLYSLGLHEESYPHFRKVRGDAEDESVKREEPRTKVLARTTELICCLRVPDLNSEVASIRSHVIQELGRVDERLTVYSQIQKRNVTKSDFQKDLDSLE